MRRVLPLAVLILAVAGPAGAQQKKSRITVPPSPAAELRGPVAAQAPPVRQSLPPAPPTPDMSAQSLFLPTPVASAPVGGAPQQCRQACAQTYYFCLAGDQQDECSASWGQCRSACDAPTLPTSY